MAVMPKPVVRRYSSTRQPMRPNPQTTTFSIMVGLVRAFMVFSEPLATRQVESKSAMIFEFANSELIAIMELDAKICYCFHVSKRKILNFIRRERPHVASQISDCGGAGTGCGWCIPY